MKPSKTIKIKYFPHIPRIFPAIFKQNHLKISLCILIVLAIIINFNQAIITSKDTEKNILKEIIHHPFQYSRHKELADYYEIRNINEATRELNLLENYANNEFEAMKILGLEFNANSNESTKELTFWQNFIRKYPDYHYALIKLSQLYFKLDRNTEGNAMMTKYRQETGKLN